MAILKGAKLLLKKVLDVYDAMLVYCVTDKTDRDKLVKFCIADPVMTVMGK